MTSKSINKTEISALPIVKPRAVAKFGKGGVGDYGYGDGDGDASDTDCYGGDWDRDMISRYDCENWQQSPNFGKVFERLNPWYTALRLVNTVVTDGLANTYQSINNRSADHGDCYPGKHFTK